MELHNPADLLKPSGFSHVVLPGPGEPIYLAGQTGHHADGSLDDSLVAQFGAACRNVATALASVEAKPDQVVSIQIFVTDVEAYKKAHREIGERYREIFGRHYPAMALFGVSSLFDPKALVELVVTAHRPLGKKEVHA
jgi:enamine deaminase RidA (YjgF/YER057c/UK114 family)